MKRRPIRMNGWQRYCDALHLCGYKSYEEYLRSPEWEQFNAWYRGSKLPQHCLVCESGRFVLHHVRYDRIGHEELWDVVPLCRPHHEEVHYWLAMHNGHVRDIQRHLVGVFGLAAKEAKKCLAPFRRLQKRSENSSVPCKECGSRIPLKQQTSLCWRCLKQSRRTKREVPTKRHGVVYDLRRCPRCNKHRSRRAMLPEGYCTSCLCKSKTASAADR